MFLNWYSTRVSLILILFYFAEILQKFEIDWKYIAMNSCQSQSIDEETMCRLNYQSLLQEFLHLQKEFVSKKKKLQITKKKREILLAEIRFLRQRHRYLMELHSHNFQSKRKLFSPEKSSVQNENEGRSFKTVKLKNSLTNNKRVKK